MVAAVFATATLCAATPGAMTSGATWLALAGVVLGAKIGGSVARMLRQPAVLGEVTVGILLGNAAVVGVDLSPGHIAGFPLQFLAELGLVLLLFEAGLESSLSDMRRIALRASLVASIGVGVPIVLGVGLMELWMPDTSLTHHLFVGAALAATSVGISLRVLKDVNASDNVEAKVIVGAAVIDDILGLVLLSVLIALASGPANQVGETIGSVVTLALVFLVGAVLFGRHVAPRLLGAIFRFRTAGGAGLLSVSMCLAFAGTGAMAGLAAIVGAYAAGLVLEDVHVRTMGGNAVGDVADFVRPLTALLGPIFFVYVGLSVDLTVLSAEALALAAALTAAAILGKVAAGLGAVRSAADPWAVGLGMVPRGEVGLVFAGVGLQLKVDGVSLIDPVSYAAIIMMVLLTTMLGPPLLAARLEALERTG